MRALDSLRSLIASGHRSGRRIVAFMLLSVVAFLVVNPLWECCDHLDNLRHLGPHGTLMILLLVAVAGLSLLKTLRWVWLNLLSYWLKLSPSSFFVRSQPGHLRSALAIDIALPLRI